MLYRIEQIQTHLCNNIHVCYHQMYDNICICYHQTKNHIVILNNLPLLMTTKKHKDFESDKCF